MASRSEQALTAQSAPLRLKRLAPQAVQLAANGETVNTFADVSPDVLARARKIKLFLMDVDGTLTDGGVCLISTTACDGSQKPVVSEMKVFDAHDGQGLSLAHTMGIQTGFITGRSSPAVARRAEELKVTFVYLGQANKTAAFEECLQKAGVTEEEVAYMGDDLPDIPLARRAGLGVCVADGAPELAAVCHFTTRRRG